MGYEAGQYDVIVIGAGMPVLRLPRIRAPGSQNACFDD